MQIILEGNERPIAVEAGDTVVRRIGTEERVMHPWGVPRERR